MSAVSTHRVHEIEQDAFTHMLRRSLIVRMLVELAIFGAASWLVLAEPASWRQAAMLFCLAVSGAAGAFQLRLARQRRIYSSAGLRSVLVNGLVMLVAAAATGGLASPFMLLVTTIVALATLNPGPRNTLPLMALLVLGIWALAVLQIRGLAGLPVALGGPAAPAMVPRFAVTWAALASGCVAFARVASLRLRRTYQDTMRQVSEAREDALALYAEQPQFMATVLGELAHEVKNPMASIKGLAGLMARDQTGKNAERMEVLRREVDRMQAAIEDLLNFSRPLGPLSQESVDLAGICASVARLHEGMLSAKSLRVAVPREGAAVVRCDPRKVKQVMVNLFQNAIDASSPGATIEIQIAPRDAGRLAVSVLDRGKGLDPQVATRLFQPGTTTKPRGSGLGLAIARTMALQQGGELAVTSREGGGCSATLVLPREGVGVAQAA